MLRYAAIFLVVAIIAAAYAFGGVTSMPATISKGLFLLFLILFMGSLVIGLTRRKK
jgi:uncharacterized membrane protein YtjA (UPF0391 family)